MFLNLFIYWCSIKINDILLNSSIQGYLEGSNHLVGVLYGLGAAVLYASVVLMNKYIKDVNGIHRTFLQFFAAAVVLTPYVYFTSGFAFSKLNTMGWMCLLIVGCVHTGVAYCMYFTSLRNITGQKAALLSYIDPLVAVFISVVVLKEAMTFWQVVGGCFILGFTLYNELSTKNEKDRSV